MANYVFQSTKQAEKCFFQLSFLAKRHVFINRQCSHSYGGYACETKANRMAIFRVDIILKKNMLYGKTDMESLFETVGRGTSFFSRPCFTTRSRSSTTFDKCELETPIESPLASDKRVVG